MQLINTNIHEDSTLTKRSAPAPGVTDRTHRPVTYIALRLSAFHHNRTTTTHTIMMVTPLTIVIMNMDGQVIKYQITSTYVLGEEFHCIGENYIMRSLMICTPHPI